MITPRALVNLLSLSRIPIALLFVALFKEDDALFYGSLLLCALAFATDILDGFCARRFGVASTMGRHWDSLGDKSFYVAIIVAFLSNNLLGPLISWALLTREIALYITRILFIEKISQIERIRPYTNWHGYFFYAMIVLGFSQMYSRLNSLAIDLYPYIQVTATASLAFGIASIFSYLKLPSEQ